MSYACPMSFIRVDTNISRINSLFVSTLVLAYFINFTVFILFFLALDFLVKLYGDKKYSPLFVLAKYSKKALRLKDSFIDGGAKRLAAYFGLLFVLLLIMAHFLDSLPLSLFVATIFLSCSLLDVLFNFCLGCKIYFIIKKIYPKFMV